MDNRKIKTNDVIKFLYDAEINWVIIKKDNKPLCWENGDIKVYSNTNDLLEDMPKGAFPMTEYAYIRSVMGENPMSKMGDFINFEDYIKKIH